MKKFENFKKAAKAFIKKPDKKSFEKQEFSIDKIKDKAKNRVLISLEFDLKQDKQDIIGCKVIKALGLLTYKLENEGFTVDETGFDLKNNKALAHLIIKEKQLPKEKIHQGPPIDREKHVKIFKKKYKKTFEKGKIIYAKVKRKFTDPRSFVKQEIKSMADTRIKSIKLK